MLRPMAMALCTALSLIPRRAAYSRLESFIQLFPQPKSLHPISPSAPDRRGPDRREPRFLAALGAAPPEMIRGRCDVGRTRDGGMAHAPLSPGPMKRSA